MRSANLLLLALLVGLCVAACGSSSTKTTAAVASAASSRTKLTACLKSQGVTLPSRTGAGRFPGGGTGTTGTPPSGTKRPSGTSGAPAGGSTPPSGGAPGGGSFGASSKTAKAVAACDKKLGIKASNTFTPGGAGGVPTAATIKKSAG